MCTRGNVKIETMTSTYTHKVILSKITTIPTLKKKIKIGKDNTVRYKR